MQPNDADTLDSDPDKGHDSTPTPPDTSQPQVLGVAAAALILGVSPRTVQRRCNAGKLSARRVLSEFGEQWEIDRAEVEKAATAPTTEATTTPRHVAPVSQPRPDDIPGKIFPVESSEGEGLAARYIARLETENDFLRSTVEQHQRSEAELRAALREALKAQPKQLTAGTPEAAPNAPESPAARESQADRQRHAAPPKAPQITPEAPVSYGDIANWLESEIGE